MAGFHDQIDIDELTGQSSSTNASGGQDSSELLYAVYGTDDHDLAKSVVIASMPALFNDARTVPAQIDMAEEGRRLWRARVSYKNPDKRKNEPPLKVGESTFDFDTTGGTFKRLEAFSQTAHGANAPDHGEAINVTDEGVEGVDVVIPQLNFSVRQKIPGSTITLSWINTLLALTGKTNNATFLGFAAGELLFLGASGSQNLDANPDITFSFAASPNLSGLSFGSISGVDKKGHEYLWVDYYPNVDANDNLTREPLGVYVAKVYESADFSALGITDPEV